MRRLFGLMLLAAVPVASSAAQPTNDLLRKVEIKPPSAAQLNESCWQKATTGIGLESALADCNAAVAMDPDEEEFRDSRALVLLRLGRLDEAIADYDRVLASLPVPATSRFGRAVARKEKGDKAGSDADLAAALKADAGIGRQFESFGIRLGSPNNAEMAAIFNADQEARKNWSTADHVAVGAADAQRRSRTQALLDAGLLQSGNDYFYAAFIFQHGSQPGDYLKAHILATISIARGNLGATWIAAATLDRYLQTIGQPQIMGTQYQLKEGQALQEPYDKTLISDDLRQSMRVPTIAGQVEQGRDMVRDMAFGAACPAIAGIASVVDNRQTRWLVVGEMHGTVETPAIFADLVCLIASSGRPIVVAVEQSTDEQRAIDAFLASDGKDQARAVFLKASMWHYPTKDGRSSQAMLALFERLRLLKAEKKIAAVVAFQPGSNIPAARDAQGYEKAMADIVTRASSSPDVLVMALVGNVHASMAKVDFGAGSYMPMAGLLPQPRTITLNAVGNGGAMWVCMRDPDDKMVCGARDSASSSVETRGLKLQRDAASRYSGTLYLGVRTTASSPAAVD